jgi:hypothetical protein
VPTRLRATPAWDPVRDCGGSTGYFKKGEHLALSENYRISEIVLNALQYFGYDDQVLRTSAMAVAAPMVC